MRRCRRVLKAGLGLAGGLLLGFLLARPECPGRLPTPRVSATPSTGSRRLLLVAVMTAGKYLDTRAKAVYETWASDLDVVFFVGEGAGPAPPGLPVVRLEGVRDGDYPPQAKSLKMMEGLWLRYGGSYEWFLRADDDAYVRGEKLKRLLAGVDSRRRLYLGQAGVGRPGSRLHLPADSNFCMGGPGVLLSAAALGAVGPRASSCLSRPPPSKHEDVELGRCVRKWAKVPCTWAYEMQTILYHNSSGANAFTGSLKQKEVHRAITLHPIKDHTNFYRIHNYMQMLKIQELQQESIHLHRDIVKATRLLNVTSKKQEATDEITLEESLLLGEQPGHQKFKPRTEDEILTWELLQRAVYSAADSNPRRKIGAPLAEGLSDVIREVMEIINKYSKERGRVIEFKEILYGYSRLDPLHGADYILDLLLVYKKYRGRKMTVPVRRHAYIQQQFTGLEIREVKVESEGGKSPERVSEVEFLSVENQEKGGPRLEVIVPVLGRTQSVKRLLRRFRESQIKDPYLSLTLVVYGDTLPEVTREVAELGVRQVRLLGRSGEFSRGGALMAGSDGLPGDALLLFLDVDMDWSDGALDRVRASAALAPQPKVFFPIVLSQYSPHYTPAAAPPLSQHAGYWRQYGYGIVAIYKKHLDLVGGFNLTIVGWGKEDVDLFERVISSGLEVVRAAEPGLIHVYHEVECSAQLEEAQLNMCKGSRADTLASVETLVSRLQKRGRVPK